MIATKIVIVTDTHLVEPNGVLHGLDSRARLDTCIRDINMYHGDAALCLFAGDLADVGSDGAYENFREAVEAFEIPWHLAIGNHDHRERFCQAFPETPVDDNGFVQAVVETPAGPFILLDTVNPGTHHGAFCEARSAWLMSALERCAGREVCLVMHHPPFEIGIPALDRIRILEPGLLRNVVVSHTNIRHIFMGHVHRPVSGSWLRIPYTMLPSTNHQVMLDLVNEEPIYFSHNHPGYGIVLMDDERVVVHTQDPLEEAAADNRR
jgi:Icc protein